MQARRHPAGRGARPVGGLGQQVDEGLLPARRGGEDVDLGDDAVSGDDLWHNALLLRAQGRAESEWNVEIPMSGREPAKLLRRGLAQVLVVGSRLGATQVLLAECRTYRCRP